MKKVVVSALSLALMAGVVPFTNATKASADTSELAPPPVVESGVPGEVVYDKNEVSVAPPTLPIKKVIFTTI
ncbi:hypothetical protein ELQ35_11465 [Peribacillus cavernae]|uniref:Uncharacterized protein n=1 Tax=Peribacillus cavernae TaxID=1674310 RepID=A0A3S0UCR3_9BACI|nr:hypothetical protein [Peribacillus cavernae]MDQ0219247.1 hypothetical protein [Peribacillus cavernae]RUQ28540.1 hypothetical protein ELQ35_11465 [Peribacillus cavernae]